MENEKIEVLVVGAGQAGIAMSEHLSDRGISHLVLEKDRIAERWRTGRWDSLVANGPAWHDRFPNLEFTELDAEDFATKDEVAKYFEQYVAQMDAPVRTGIEVTKVTRNEGRPGFTAQTSEGTIEADYVVAATGPFQKPVIPQIVPETEGVQQIHSSSYRNPQQLPEGNVLVVGAGSSGVQIADELRASGRQVHLAVGPHDRPPRRYRGQDFVWWLGVLNKWEMSAPPQGAEHVTIAVSGANGGNTVNFRTLAHQGITLVGRASGYRDGILEFDADLAENVSRGDANYLSLLDEADAYIEANGLDFPEEPEARDLGALPECINDPIRQLDLAAAGITTIIWATGFSVDYSWLEADTFDERGRPKHQKGVAEEAGVYFVGLPWQSRRGSSFIWGVWHDARYIADQIMIQRGYAAHPPMKQPAALSAAAV